jgi:hypothetical protein
MLLILGKNPCRCQAENPLNLLSEFVRPALRYVEGVSAALRVTGKFYIQI